MNKPNYNDPKVDDCCDSNVSTCTTTTMTTALSAKSHSPTIMSSQQTTTLSQLKLMDFENSIAEESDTDSIAKSMSGLQINFSNGQNDDKFGRSFKRDYSCFTQFQADALRNDITSFQNLKSKGEYYDRKMSPHELEFWRL